MPQHLHPRSAHNRIAFVRFQVSTGSGKAFSKCVQQLYLCQKKNILHNGRILINVSGYPIKMAEPDRQIGFLNAEKQPGPESIPVPG